MTAAVPKASREALCLTETVPDPCAIVIFGASGDLARRKLIPSVFHLHSAGALPSGYRVVGVGRTPLSDEAFRESMRGALPAGAPAAKTADFLDRLSYLAGDIQSPEFYSGLERRLAELSREHGLKGRLFYLSTPPSAYPVIAERLAGAGLAADAPGAWSRIVIEKPFGYDLASARALNALVHKCFREDQVYRIDHYLGKETVQNLLMFRFANALFEPAWNRNHIDHVQITSFETLGVEHRAGYYDQAGVLRDMFQNHLTQLLAMIAMEPPARFSADAVRDKKVEIFKAVRPLTAEALERDLVLGQYAAGAAGGKPVPAYRDEPGVSAGSAAPTFAALKLEIDNWRWQGVPFYLRSGKRLGERLTEISVHFKRVPVSIFRPLDAEELCPNVLRFRIQPEESVSIRFEAKRPGPKLCLSPVSMNFSYRETFGAEPPEAYARLLLDAMAGDQTIFARADGVEECWRVLDPALKFADERGESALRFYPAGTWGPDAAGELLTRDGRGWEIGGHCAVPAKATAGGVK